MIVVYIYICVCVYVICVSVAFAAMVYRKKQLPEATWPPEVPVDDGDGFWNQGDHPLKNGRTLQVSE